jgi:hypothetical protein
MSILGREEEEALMRMITHKFMGGARRGQPDWPPEMVEALRRLLEEGLSASQIGAQLKPPRSRNAVLGKLYRLRRRGAL